LITLINQASCASDYCEQLPGLTFKEGYLPLNPGQAGSGYNSSDAWDYFHINSVDKDADGKYYIPARRSTN